ncbi:helix-turn-helix transcriptional regulator [Salmonella enterica]|nr:helix-turn-helix transcriptional regulator [Salmonella enterica]EBY3151569.1 XRE family transcriptional regulator [Salmonella enterica subsp. enterica serovar Teshie]ECD6622052.1 XRE family transcriptional regulator [Salmonella enterica subsp. enterica]EIN0583683.1 helix-turn-helix transcriptional regulator [Salmonella enterica subsp. enterica serovar Newport]ECF3547478.1 XRE family transcriptional regulator [Salmonella enterica subsp. enterica]
MVPKRLKEARKAVGLSQERLSELIGIEGVSTRSRLSSYEVGRTEPPFSLVQKIAEVLGYPEYYFYTVNDVTAKLLLQMHRGEKDLPEGIESEARRMAEQLDDARKLAAQLTECLKSRSK